VAEKSVKPRQSGKPGIGARISKWWRETVGELRKVSWPTPPEAWRLTKIVLAVMFIMAVVLGLLDFVFSSLIRFILG
jgi:preprotein translocase subunit SecE